MKHTGRIFLACLVVSGCGGSSQSPSTPESAARIEPAKSSNTPATSATPSSEGQVLSLQDSVSFCVRLHEQVVPCAGEFIDLNIELRSRYFPDFAAAAADPAKKAEMRRVGIEEVMADGAGPLEPRQKRCREYAEHGPPTPSGAVPQMEACYAKASCAEKMDCMRPVLEERYSKRAAAPPAAE